MKRATDDHLVEIQDDVPLGKTYSVDLDSIQEIEMFNYVHGVFHVREWIFTVSKRGNWGKALPVELLSLPVKDEYKDGSLT